MPTDLTRLPAECPGGSWQEERTAADGDSSVRRRRILL
ncbi:conserved hypothetical protein [Treponema pallidum subsp. pallidum str. Chicago]|nr:conserved hypothetical protein [Treponema pallidum subsp. pallidum str. Chicago]